MQCDAVEAWSDAPGAVAKCLTSELQVLAEIDAALAALSRSGELPTALDNFLRGLAEKHQRDNVYLLRQRQGGVFSAVVARAGQPPVG